MIIGTIYREFYLGYQDGPVNDVKYETLKTAEAALKTFSKLERKGICVMWRDYMINANGEKVLR